MVRYLLESGADVNIRGTSARSGPWYAYSDSVCFEIDNRGETPLQLVRRLRPMKDADIVELLRGHGAVE
jgi:ankyrin repeat protein